MDKLFEINRLIELLKIKNELLQIKLSLLEKLPISEEMFFENYISNYYSIVKDYLKKIEEVQFECYFEYLKVETSSVLQIEGLTEEKTLIDFCEDLKSKNKSLKEKIEKLEIEKKYFYDLYNMLKPQYRRIKYPSKDREYSFGKDSGWTTSSILDHLRPIIEEIYPLRGPIRDEFFVQLASSLFNLLNMINDIDNNEERIDAGVFRRFALNPNIKELPLNLNNQSLNRLYSILEEHKDVILENIEEAPLPNKWVVFSDGKTRETKVKPISFYPRNLFLIIGEPCYKEGVLDHTFDDISQENSYLIYVDKDFNFYKGFLIKNFSTIDGLSAQDKEIPKTGLGEIFEEVIFQISPEDLEEMELPCGEISYSLLDELFLSELEERLYVIENPEFMMEINKFILEEFDLRDAKNNNCKKLNPNIKKQRTNDLPF